MTNSVQKSNSVINKELTNDLHFLALEVKHLLELVRKTLATLDQSRLESVKKRLHYIENLKSRIETLSYESIFQLKSKNRDLILHYRALIQIAGSLAKIGDFLVQAANQVVYIEDHDAFKKYDLSNFYSVIDKQLKRIHKAYTEIDKKSAERICKSEEKLDELYADQFEYIQENIAKKGKSSDMITLLFIVRYFERIGDSFLNIGESILNITIGDALNIDYYRKLEAAVADLTSNDERSVYDFKPFLFSRSGCKVGRLLLVKQANEHTEEERLFFKQGEEVKIKEEIEGLELWNEKFEGFAPKIRWQSIDDSNSTLIVDYVPGENVLNLVLGDSKNNRIKKIGECIAETLEYIWGNSIKRTDDKSKLVKQIISRKEAITNVHEDFFESFEIGNKKKEKIDFASILEQAKQMEKSVVIPNRVLCHGDFNLDNILYDVEQNKIHFVDVHRSGMGDYAQEVSVFVVSALRIKLDDVSIHKKINTICKAVYQFAVEFAEKNDDSYFQARFAFGLFRSFITSTRFVTDDEWYQKMRLNALYVYQCLEASQDDFTKFSFKLDKVLY